MQIANEIIAVLLAQAHEGAAHDNELDLVDGVAELPELLEAVPGLQVGVVAGADGAHRRGLVARVGLRGVLEVAVGAARAVHADVARHVDVGAAVRLAHERDDRDAGRRAHRLGAQLGQQQFFVLQRHLINIYVYKNIQKLLVIF